MIPVIEESNLLSDEKDILSKIKSWKYNNDINEVGPTIWQTWFDKLTEITWDEISQDTIALEYPFKYQTIYMMKEYPNDKFMDIMATPEIETAHDLFIKSFKYTVTIMKDIENNNGNLNWGDRKATYVGHLLQGLQAFSKFNIPIGGYSGIVNATSQNHGPSWRMIVEMSSPPKALGIYPGGQSGNPGSKYYDNLISDWASGNYLELNFMKDQKDDADIIFSQILNPQND